MDRSIVVELIAEAYTVDALRQTVTTETAREVFAAIRSVSRTEWDAAGNQGLRPDFQITMFAPDYEGEKSSSSAESGTRSIAHTSGRTR